ncbi:MAG: 4Fe-4S binding protein [Bacteroidales bacterium]|nr:4Fe-4S binding protein [Bacteroidales bacterium]MCF8390828.1 4Fe-4S binding protein [Bacteroidales bacterium]
MKKKKTTNWPRIAIQWSVILAVVYLALLAFFKDDFIADFEAYCPFGGIQAIGSYLLNQSLACTMTSTQIVMGVLLILGVFLFSKLFCAYICPIGTISEWLGTLGDKLKIRITIKGVLDKVLRSLKYILLFITLYFTFKTNELFCKEYDPFYAIVSGYDMDVTALYASLAIAIVILGSIFIRLFWCKYLCPLGAISNIFKFTGFFVAVLIIYIALLLFDVPVHYAWPLGIASVGGYIIELLGQKSRLFPIAKITRNEDTCTSCQLCSIKCPQNIDVAKLKVVNDVDCNLCSECILVCPEKDTIQINKKKNLKWLPPIAIAALFAIGLLLQSVWEIPTIDQKWFSPEEMANSQTYSRSGLKNIKCFGSSSAFAAKMKRVKGVYGVATFVGDNKVDVYYDPTILTELEIEEIIFTPSKVSLRSLKENVKEVKVETVLLENFFDTYDFNYLSVLLQQKTEALGLISEYGCPIIIKIYFPDSTIIDEKELIEILESESLTYQSGEKNVTKELNYEVMGDIKSEIISIGEYMSLLFDPYKMAFNNYDTYDSTVVKVYSVEMGENRKFSKRLAYLVSHISNDKGVIELKTSLSDDFREMIEISFVDSMTNSEQIFEMINMDTLNISYTDGTTSRVANMFHFNEEGTLIDRK